MNIVYQGSFLREGLTLLGHNVIDIPYGYTKDINVEIESLDCSVDFVLIELWGSAEQIVNIADCKYKLVAYCIDSSINEFWMIELCKLFDYVFVDQLSTVDHFKEYNINAFWLPLCTQESYFRTSIKKYDITFIGRITEERPKRRNLINLISQYYTINIFQDVSAEEMLTIFSQSKIILNENLFDGLTLRIFQGLATNSIVLTEENANGVDKYFQDGKHLICYNSSSIIEKISTILSNYEKFQVIAQNGYKLCKKFHTSKVRAEQLLSIIANNSPCISLDSNEKKFYETKALYLKTMRYSGVLSSIIDNFCILIKKNTKQASMALYELGNIYARQNNIEFAEQCFLHSINEQNNCYAWLKLAILYIHTEKFIQAKEAIYSALNIILLSNTIKQDLLSQLIQKKSTNAFDLLFLIAKIYFSLGHIYHIGFCKQFYDNYPDTAMEIALMAWHLQPCSIIMDFILMCAKKYNIEGELLPELLNAITKNQLSNQQILYTAKIAEQYYDLETAKVIVFALKENIIKNKE